MPYCHLPTNLANLACMSHAYLRDFLMLFPTQKLSILFVATIAVSVSAYCEEPILAGKSANGSSLYYVALDISGEIKTVRTRLVYPTPQVVGDIKNVIASVSVEQIDCRMMTRNTTHIELYENPDATGIPVWTKDISPAERNLVTIDLNAQTASTIIYRAVCSIRTTTTVPSKPPQNSSVAVPNVTPPSVAPSSPDLLPQPGQRPIIVSNDTTTAPQTPTQTSPPNNSNSIPQNTPQYPIAEGYRPRVVEAIAGHRPFPNSIFTLGVMGKLAEYVYYDRKELDFHEATFEKIQRGRDKVLLDGQKHSLIEEAYRRIDMRVTDYREKLGSKGAFLEQAKLEVVPLPKVGTVAISTFRAELYRHQPSGEMILVFRGTKEPLDWVSNLWTGVDLLSIEAPHYRAAHDLVSALRKRGDRPLVVGHSLGGGMAQYVGFKFGLKVVGFNSAPLPERYYSDGEGANVQFIRLFSAVENGQRQGMPIPAGYPDPVSITLPDEAGAINQLFVDYAPIKARQHLTKPICIKSVPDPFLTEREKRLNLALVNTVLSKGVASALAGGVIPKVGPIALDQAIIANIKSAVKSGLSDPIWRADNNPKVDNKKVAEAVKDEVTKIAVQQYTAIGGATSVAKGGYKLAFGNSWGDMFSGIGTLAAATGKLVAVDYAITHWLLPHSMERLNRGMRSVANADVFLADPVRAQCQTSVTTYQ